MNDEKAALWNKRNSGGGEPYKKYVLDPAVLKICGELNGKVVLDQGCGNGQLAKKIIKFCPKEFTLFDLYQGNLDYAKKNLSSLSKDIIFVRGNLNHKTELPSNHYDVLISSMTLPEVKNLKAVIEDSYRILKLNGIYAISVVHPAYSLKMYLKETWLKKKTKIIPKRHYFDEQKSTFLFGEDTHSDFLFGAPHYNRSIEAYFKVLADQGFIVEKIEEPKTCQKLLEAAPRFEKDLDCPISLIIRARKS